MVLNICEFSADNLVAKLSTPFHPWIQFNNLETKGVDDSWKVTCFEAGSSVTGLPVYGRMSAGAHLVPVGLLPHPSATAVALLLSSLGLCSYAVGSGVS